MLAGFGIWTVLAGLAVAEAAINATCFDDRDKGWQSLVADWLTNWYSYGLFMPLLVWPSRGGRSTADTSRHASRSSTGISRSCR